MHLAASNLVPLNGIHFLIHPMYDAFSGLHPSVVTESEFVARGGEGSGCWYVEEAQVKADLQRYPRLVSAYLERASAVRGREVLLTFLPAEQGALNFVHADFEPHFERLTTGLKRLLHGRSLLFFGDVDPVNSPESLDGVRRALTRKGWAVPAGLPSYAFGETLDHCVPRAVRHLREELGLTKSTLVHPYFTDLHFSWPMMTATERQRIKTRLRADHIMVRDWITG